MKIGQYPLQLSKIDDPEIVARGTVLIPLNAKVIYFGAQGDGSIFLWAEVPEIETGEVGEVEVVLLRAGQKVPDDYKFRGAIVGSTPLLFIYQPPPKEESVIVTLGG